MSANSTGVYSHLFKSLPADWMLLAFSDAVDFQEGPGILAVDFHENGVPLLRLSSIAGKKTTYGGCNFLSPEKVARKWSHFKLNEGDILLSTSGSLGRVSEVAKEQEGSLCYTGIIRFRPKVDGLKKSFIKYFLQSRLFERQASSSAAGSVLKHFGPSHLKQMSFPIPPEECQAFIEQLIEPIDDKIDLNRRIKRTLEAMAQALFKSWFVDFDPVKAKIAAIAEGRDPLRAAMGAISGKSDADLDALPREQFDPLAAIAALFPDEMEDSELGEIPRGWGVNHISQFGDVVCGKTPSKANPEYFGAGIPFVKIPDMHNSVYVVSPSERVTALGAASQAKKTIPSGSICVSCIATVGKVVITHELSQTNQQINSIVPKFSQYTVYLYFQMKEKGKQFHDLASGGSATLNMNTSTFSKVKVLMPNFEILTKFSVLVTPLFSEILLRQKESAILSETRDTLLPKLLSGELPVTEAVAEAGA